MTDSDDSEPKGNTAGDETHALSPALLLKAYSVGIFPMSDSADDEGFFWVEPNARGIIPLDGLHVSKSLRKTVRKDHFHVTINTAFSDVIHKCGEHTHDRPDTWINPQIKQACIELHNLGYAHSVECWIRDDTTPDTLTMVGGLYGIALQGAFFGESMFSRVPNASKVALVHLVARLRHAGFTLLDTQFTTPHLIGLGATDITKEDYQSRLKSALKVTADFRFAPTTLSGQQALGFLQD